MLAFAAPATVGAWSLELGAVWALQTGVVGDSRDPVFVGTKASRDVRRISAIDDNAFSRKQPDMLTRKSGAGLGCLSDGTSISVLMPLPIELRRRKLP